MAPHWHDTGKFYRGWADTEDAKRMDRLGSFATLLGILRSRVQRWKEEDAGTWKPKGPWEPGFGHLAAESVKGYRPASGFDPCELPSAALAKEILADKKALGFWPPKKENSRRWLQGEGDRAGRGGVAAAAAAASTGRGGTSGWHKR